MGVIVTDGRILDYTARLRRELVTNKELATKISAMLAKYKLEVPDDMMVVWGPTVIEEAQSAFEINRIWEIGIPPPELLEACYNYEAEFRLIKGKR